VLNRTKCDGQVPSIIIKALNKHGGVFALPAGHGYISNQENGPLKFIFTHQHLMKTALINQVRKSFCGHVLTGWMIFTPFLSIKIFTQILPLTPKIADM